MKRHELAKLLGKALRELDLAERVEEALDPPGSTPARVVAIGKAAPAMAAGAIARWGSAIERCVVIAPDDTDVVAPGRVAARARIDDRLVVLRAAHPLPDARSVRAAAACLDAVSSVAPRRVLVLISGGASALVCAPAPGITLRTKRAVTTKLLGSGASVQDLNVVRKHLSRIKGGGLARAAGTNPVLTLIASDVIGGTAADVGSGPSVPDPSSAADARRVLRRFAPAFADLPLARTYRPTGEARRLRARLVASPEALALAVAKLLRERGLVVRVLPPSQARAEELAAEYVARAKRPAPCALVRIAEPSLVVPARAGKGGRSTHLAALVGRALSPLRGALFAAFASDGVDGPSGTGGAIVDERFTAAVEARAGTGALDRALARYDTGPLHRAAGTALPRAPTGHNLADVHVLLLD